MRALILVLIISLIGCSNAHSSDGASKASPLVTTAGEVHSADSFSRLHDDEKHVTCYVLSGYQLGGIYCIPDYQLNSKGK